MDRAGRLHLPGAPVSEAREIASSILIGFLDLGT